MKTLLLFTVIALPTAAFGQSFTSEVTVNLNTNTPPGLQGLSGQILGEFTPTDTTVGRIIFDSFGPQQSAFDFRASLGSNASPSALTSGSLMGTVQWTGYEANGGSGQYVSSARASIGVGAAESWSTTANGTYLSFNTTQLATTTISEKMRLFGDGGLTIGNAIVTTDPGAENLLIGGAVGIGITDPATQLSTYKLAVAGTIEAYEVVVQTGWSDYVFKKGYCLRPLSEVEAYVRTEHHLPGVPSEKEIAEKGIGLGDMQSKLLAQIEQLTLHQIEQEKRVNELSTLMREQAQQITILKAANASLRFPKRTSQ